MRPSRLALLTLLGLTFHLANTAQNAPPAAAAPLQPMAEPQRTIADAVHRLTGSHVAETRFTRFHLEHNQVFREDGRPLPPHSKLYEDTWINNLPYKHLVEFDGKPLTGPAQAAEQARLDQALADHRALDLTERARETHGHLFSTALPLTDISTPAYTLRSLHADTCAADPCRVYSADPVDPRTHPVHFELWVVETPEPFLFRLSYELTANQGDLYKGSTGLLEFQIFDGVPVEKHTLFTGFVQVKGHFLRIATDNTFTRYRHFATSAAIRPASDPDPASPNPTPQPPR